MKPTISFIEFPGIVQIRTFYSVRAVTQDFLDEKFFRDFVFMENVPVKIIHRWCAEIAKSVAVFDACEEVSIFHTQAKILVKIGVETKSETVEISKSVAQKIVAKRCHHFHVRVCGECHFFCPALLSPLCRNRNGENNDEKKDRFFYHFTVISLKIT